MREERLGGHEGGSSPRRPFLPVVDPSLPLLWSGQHTQSLPATVRTASSIFSGCPLPPICTDCPPVSHVPPNANSPPPLTFSTALVRRSPDHFGSIDMPRQYKSCVKTHLASLSLLRCTRKICSRPLMSGVSTVIMRSKLRARGGTRQDRERHHHVTY